MPVGAFLSLVDGAILSGMYFVAEYQLQQLAKAYPKMVEPKLRLLKLSGYTGKREVIDQLMAELKNLKINKIELLDVMSELTLNAGDAEHSLTYINELVKVNPNSSKAYRYLAMANEALAEKEKAVDAYDVSINKNPQSADSLYGRALLLGPELDVSQQQQVDLAISKSYKKLKNHAMVNLAKAWSCYGDVHEEFSYLDKAKHSMVNAFEWSKEKEWENLKDIRDFSNKEKIDSSSMLGSRTDAPVFVVGMPRSGTTLIETILSAHPAFVATGERHIIPYACDQVGLKKGKSGAVWQWGKEENIEELLNDLDERVKNHASVVLAEGKRWIDKSIENIKYMGIVKMIYPRAKFIHMQRNPMAICLSIYQHYIVLGRSTPITLQQLAEYHVIFEQSVEAWKEIFCDDIISVKYESIVENMELEIRKVLNFLDVEWDESCGSFHTQKSTILTPSTIQVKKPINSSARDRWMEYEEYLQPVSNVLAS